ncbi:MAG: KamA family radical SAM protein [Candidatus Omnitrophica bacterium]|nr:KamA family radical SAM protein [Candidatus Omnitrophota bacterium]
MEYWQKLMSKSFTDGATLARCLRINKRDLCRVEAEYPISINPYYLSLIREKNDPIWKQCVPNIHEIRQTTGRIDPLLEEKYSPIEGLIHRYDDRVLLYVSNACAGYCRFCTRKRKVGIKEKILKENDFIKAFRYIARHKAIRDVIISGGDPLLLEDDKIEYYLKYLKKIKHIQIIRIDSRTPCILPQRITPKLCEMLKKYSPIYFNTHFNHFQEITDASIKACNMLADSGIVLGNQTVLMAGVNDDSHTLKRLFEGLLMMRVRPYYMYIPDAVKGTYHFRVSIVRALKIMRELIGHTSGMAVPRLILDLKHGGGKTPLLPRYIVKRKGRRYVFRNFENRKFYYADIE